MKLWGVTSVLLVMAWLASCSPGQGEATVRLNEEFTLSVGQRVRVEGEDLRMEFLEVVADSRCPKDVTCNWAGEVRCLVELVSSGSAERLELTQPGLSGEPSRQAFKGYEISFAVDPYPQEGKQISRGDYRLRLTVRKGVSLSRGILVLVHPHFSRSQHHLLPVKSESLPTSS